MVSHIQRRTSNVRYLSRGMRSWPAVPNACYAAMRYRMMTRERSRDGGDAPDQDPDDVVVEGAAPRGEGTLSDQECSGRAHIVEYRLTREPADMRNPDRPLSCDH